MILNYQNTQYEWIAAVLINDEISSDDEVYAYFIDQGLTKDEAAFYTNQRNDALLDPLNFHLITYVPEKDKHVKGGIDI